MASTYPSTALYFTAGTSDKEYRAWITGADGGYLVNYAYGRRGAALKTGTKTPAPVSLDTAVETYEKLVASKVSKGYTPDTDGDPYTSTDKSEAVSGIVPQLLTVADQDAANAALDDDQWHMQEKYDGKRMMLRKTGDTVEAINKLGLLIEAPAPVAEEARLIDADFIIDGELVADTLYAFDILECSLHGANVNPHIQALIDSHGADLRGAPYRDRHAILTDLIALNTPLGYGGGTGGIDPVPSWATGCDKRNKLTELRSAKAEGVVFKRLDAPYTAGRPNSGGPQLKFKFVETLSALVTAVNSKRSVGLSLHSGGGLAFVGNVTIPANFEMPEVGAVVEVRYLYANPMLYQPVYLGVRDDILPEECVMSQVKFKSGAAEAAPR